MCDSKLSGFKFFPQALAVLCFVAGQYVKEALRSTTKQATVLIAMKPLFNVSRKTYSMTQKNEQAGSPFIIRISSLCLDSRSRLFLLTQYPFFLTSRNKQLGCGERSSLTPP